MRTYDQLSSAILNNIVGGLKLGTGATPFTIQQIEDSIISERLTIIKEYSAKNLIPIKDLMLPINCLELDCESLERCCANPADATMVKHVQIPQIFNDFGEDAIAFFGPNDFHTNYKVYTDLDWRHHKHKTRGKYKPFIWIDTTPNSNNLYDAFLFNAPPLLQSLSIRAIFKDTRQLLDFACCNAEEVMNITFIDSEIEKRVTEKYIRYYRQMAMTTLPNDQTIKP